MQNLFILFFILCSTLWGNFIDLSVDQRSNYRFQEQFFLDIDTTEYQEKVVDTTNLDLDININDMGGILYNTLLLENSDTFETKSFYIGSDETIYFSYTIGEKNIFYNNLSETRDSKDEYKKFSFLDILTVEKHKYSSKKNEDYSYVEDGVVKSNNDLITRKYNKEIYKISTDELYRKVKNEALKGEDFYYGIAGAKKLRPNFRVYGLLLASYEYHDISEGIAYDTQERSIKETWVNSDDITYYEDIKGKFKGIGYGYHITAELFYKDISFFITNYYKKLKLSNYHTNVRNYVNTSDDPTTPTPFEVGVIRTKNIELTQQYTSFGLHYRF